MLLCPRCQFENPNLNKFCQQCGNSLTYKACHQCGTQVAVSAELCQNCGVTTGQVWRAIICGRSNFPAVQLEQSTIPSAELTQKTDNFPETRSAQNSPQPIADHIKTEITADSPQLDAAESSSPEIKGAPIVLGAIATESFQTDQKSSNTAPDGEITPSENNFTTAPQPETDSPEGASPPSPEIPLPYSEYLIPSQPAGAYLDSQQRYQLLETLPARKPSDTVAVTVLDCQPLQMSPLKAMLAANSASVAKRTSPYTAAIKPGENATNGALAELCQGIAEPYLALRWQFSHNLPVIHDSWSDNQQAVLLLEDCSQWPLLVERWSQPETSIQQIVYWLHEMTELWAALEPWRCRQSLLELTNLRVNPDSSFSFASLRLQYLYPEPAGSNLQLIDLGQLWQAIFNQSDRTQFGALLELLQQMYRGEINTIEELRSRLETVPLELQPAPPPTLTPTRFQTDIPDNSPPEVVGEVLTQPMPVQIYSLEDAGLTDVGRTREHNEDFFSIWTQLNKLETSFGRIFQTKGLYILCDGMGGHDSGEVASQLAAETLREFFQTSWENQLPEPDTIRQGVLLANKTIFEINQKDGRSGSGRMGTTLVAVLVQDTKFAVAHVGDSRLYRLRKGQTLEKITSDHEVGQREIKRGVDAETAYSRPDAYQLTQAIGPRDGNFLKPDVQFLDLCEDTLLILASDGLTDNDLLETHWRDTLEPLFNPQANLDEGVAELIELGNKRNGHDNITAIIIRAQVGPFRF
ncbi:MAG: serine/threonine phosphatase [Oscillatoriales cyanobacterium]|uniref:serine/threonine phosphatase n=1 Tax=unclassified Microcoleus TaxID=2642155 RepID=UPI001D6432CD|nr:MULTISPECIES: serine/threonine phosphatase [unclassified Microcoleus]TAE81115.1 MAG: serine/threonine phosphatase [Oscillatoriales cyanobacterium]TAF18603.1 MAG: serine/threonine phosphatase [Oscillatoriales cyanobacterium]TAF36705.1 MAG: serine/threonine phosphatase [Oscillatoriales cyanobacterium]